MIAAPSGVQPTAYGRALLDGGTAAFDGLHQALKDIEFLADPTAGEVRIGCSSILATSFVSTVIERLAKRSPKFVFHFVIASIEGTGSSTQRTNLDVVIAQRLGPIADERLDFEFVFDASFVVAAGTQNPLVRRRKIALAELVNKSYSATADKCARVHRDGSVSFQRARLSSHDSVRNSQ